MNRYSTTNLLAAGGKPLRVAYGLVLRAEFVPAGEVSGCATGKTCNPHKELYFKILPMGSCSVDGALLGYPTLDSEPYGLDHYRAETTHVFRALNVALPRGELDRRAEYRKSRTYYTASPNGDVGCVCQGKAEVQYLGDEACNALHEAAAVLAHFLTSFHGRAYT